MALDTCYFAEAEHATILPKGAAAARTWATAGTLTCPVEATTPPCE